MPTSQSAYGATERGLVQPLILAAGRRFLKPSRMASSSMLEIHSRFMGLVCSRQMVDGAEDKLALASASQALMTSRTSSRRIKLFQEVELLILILSDLEAPRLRHDRQVVVSATWRRSHYTFPRWQAPPDGRSTRTRCNRCPQQNRPRAYQRRGRMPASCPQRAFPQLQVLSYI